LGHDPGKARANIMEKIISRIEAENTVNAWNAKIDTFMKVELPKLLESEGIPVKNGRISMNGWFKANEIINRQNFYEEGHAILRELREAGYDVKMNMQDHTLTFPRWW
jgi:hypothetical protein